MALIGMIVPLLFHWRRSLRLVASGTVEEVGEEAREEEMKVVRDAEVQHDENRNESKVS